MFLSSPSFTGRPSILSIVQKALLAWLNTTAWNRTETYGLLATGDDCGMRMRAATASNARPLGFKRSNIEPFGKRWSGLRAAKRGSI